MSQTPLQRFIKGELPALRVEPDGRQRAWEGSPGDRTPALLAGSFNPLHAGHLSLAQAAARLLAVPVAFELCVCNADKPALGAAEVTARLRQFAWRQPVWLTRAPTFVAKAELFDGAVFVVGVDTAERILLPRFYTGAAVGLELALRGLRGRGCRFLVAARRTPAGGVAGLGDLTIPAEFADLFLELPAAEFRHDISSTQLRQPVSDRHGTTKEEADA